MSEKDNQDIEVVATRRTDCIGGIQHVSAVKIKDGDVIEAGDVMLLMDAGKNFIMTPPKGAPAYQAHVETGLPLLIQTMICPHCKERVLFA